MASSRAAFFLSLLVPAIILLSQPAFCNDKEDDLFQGLTSYRRSLGLPAFSRNKTADCLADKIADKIEDQPCTNSTAALNATPGMQPQVKDYPKLLSKCNIEPNSTKDAAILPVCVRKLVPTLVLTNYTRSQYARFFNDSSYVGAGVGSEGDWMVVVLTTKGPGGTVANPAGGTAANTAGLGSNADSGYFLVRLFLGMVAYLLS